MNTKQRKKLLLEHREYKCEICSNTGIWNELPLSLQIDHIDGNSSNEDLSNLRFLCPNCHSQTSTFTGKNAKYKNFAKPDKEEFINLFKLYSLKEISILKAVSLRTVYQWFKFFVKENKQKIDKRKLSCTCVKNIRESKESSIKLSKVYFVSDNTIHDVRKFKTYKDCN